LGPKAPVVPLLPGRHIDRPAHFSRRLHGVGTRATHFLVSATMLLACHGESSAPPPLAAANRVAAPTDDISTVCTKFRPSPRCEDLCLRGDSIAACERLITALPDPGDAKEFLYRERACALGAPESCYIGGRMASVGRGTTRSAEREVALGERGCALGSKDACVLAATALRVLPLQATDIDGRRAEALFVKGGDFHGAADVASDRCNHLCTLKLPKGEDGCTEALRDYQNVLAQDTTITAEERDASYGSKVRLACEHLKFAECANYPELPEESPPTTLP